MTEPTVDDLELRRELAHKHIASDGEYVVGDAVAVLSFDAGGVRVRVGMVEGVAAWTLDVRAGAERRRHETNYKGYGEHIVPLHDLAPSLWQALLANFPEPVDVPESEVGYEAAEQVFAEIERLREVGTHG